MRVVTVVREGANGRVTLTVKGRREVVTNRRHLERRLAELVDHGYRIKEADELVCVPEAARLSQIGGMIDD